MSKTSRSAGVRFRRTTYLRWWQIRPIEFSLLLLPIIIQRVLVLGLFVLASTFADGETVELAFALDATYAGLHSPSILKHIIILSWVLLLLAAISAAIERCYRWPKALLIFVGLAFVMGEMTQNALWVYEPYLALRR